MAGTAEKNNRPTLVAGEVATRPRPPERCAGSDGASSGGWQLVDREHNGALPWLHSARLKSREIPQCSAHDSGSEALTYMPVPNSKPARLLIRGTIEMYQ
jgi:hypothetical protein